MADLEEVMNGPEQTEQAQPEPVEPEVVVEPEVAPEPEKAEEAPSIPVSVVQELRREIRELKAASQRQPEQPAPDVIEDPDGYRDYVARNVNQSVTNTKLEMSRFMAEREFGKETVEAAYEYFDAHPEQTQEFLKAPSPFHAAVEAFNKHRVTAEIGDDPAAYRAKLEAEIRASVQAELVAKQARDAAGKFAPSMANVTGTGGGPKSNWTGPTSLKDVIGE